MIIIQMIKSSLYLVIFVNHVHDVSIQRKVYCMTNCGGLELD